ncbi:helix-turn-helix transcriptional regulator [uncultured Victivallis sp.]|uniref:helix-turn-helix domain-containing protein n=1 Tax=uncultured Victivallis sp. TaxID=354118 RepID=UPI0025E5F005|nr:helix-turn-helix transcriptional regulator [uncultured Victivallis sp.]
MSPYLDKRRELGIWLKVLLAKYGIRQTQIASRLGITRQYVCQICGGKSPLAPEHFKTIYEMLLEMHAAEADLRRFVQLHVDSKIMIPYIVGADLADIEITLLRKFRKLPPARKDQVIIYIERCLESDEP